jgi:hypothetical protein
MKKIASLALRSIGFGKKLICSLAVCLCVSLSLLSQSSSVANATPWDGFWTLNIVNDTYFWTWVLEFPPTADDSAVYDTLIKAALLPDLEKSTFLNANLGPSSPSGWSLSSPVLPTLIYHGSTVTEEFGLDDGSANGSPQDPLSPSPASTPLPAALPLFATGLGALGLLGWRRRRKAQAVAA